MGLGKDCGSVGQRPKQQHRTDAGRVAGPIGLGLLGVRLVGLASLAVLAWALGSLPRWRDPDASWSPWLACIVLLHPGMLFAIGRGYSEPLGALLGGVMLLAPFHPALFGRIRSGKPRTGAAMLAIIVAVSISTAAAAALLAVKGLNPWWAMGWAMNLIGWCDPIGFGNGKPAMPQGVVLSAGSCSPWCSVWSSRVCWASVA